MTGTGPLWTSTGAPPNGTPTGPTEDPFNDLDRLAHAADEQGHWQIAIAYAFGHLAEPTTTRGHGFTSPLLHARWIPAHGPSSADALEPDRAGAPRHTRLPIGGETAYRQAVSRAIRLIHAGDVFQVNLAHTLGAEVDAAPAAVASALMAAARPRHGLVMPIPGDRPGDKGRVLACASPELFLRVEGGRVVTRPMKGTRPGGADPVELRDAPKDRAELAMIVDLMRNDLGRVCEFGSVSVDRERVIERHGCDPEAGRSGVLQAIAEISGTLPPGVGFGKLLRATFPPGSITGAPKVRAMQIINELESFERGFYCGCCGTLTPGADWSAELGVSIRTATISERTDGGSLIEYPVGAGIVADSDPDAEWRETLDKAGVLRAAIEHTRTPTATGVEPAGAMR
ncbi:MAG: chorismate-binding protein [Planctomycetota bacterium]